MEASKLSLYFLTMVLNSLFCSGQSLPVSTSTNEISTVSSDVNDMETLYTTLPPTDTPVNGTSCLIDFQTGMIAVASAGGLILCLLVSVLVLACEVCHLQRRVRAPRPSRSNADLVSGTGYWGTDCPEEVGIVGPCDTSVMLEEVRADKKPKKEEEKKEKDDKEEKTEEREEKEEEEKAIAALITKPVDSGDGEMAMQMKSSNSRDSCLEVPENLEDMPLVV